MGQKILKKGERTDIILHVARRFGENLGRIFRKGARKKRKQALPAASFLKETAGWVVMKKRLVSHQTMMWKVACKGLSMSLPISRRALKQGNFHGAVHSRNERQEVAVWQNKKKSEFV